MKHEVHRMRKHCGINAFQHYRIIIHSFAHSKFTHSIFVVFVKDDGLATVMTTLVANVVTQYRVATIGATHYIGSFRFVVCATLALTLF